jgi:hypothetical protein
VVAPNLKSTAGLLPPSHPPAPSARGSVGSEETLSTASVAVGPVVTEPHAGAVPLVVADAEPSAPDRPATTPRSLTEAVQLPIAPVVIPIAPAEGTRGSTPAPPGSAPEEPAVRPRPSRFVPTTLQTQPTVALPSAGGGNGATTHPDIDQDAVDDGAAEIVPAPARERSRVPIDAHAPIWLEPQARPLNRPIRTRGSGEWKDRRSSYPTMRGRGIRAIPAIAVGFTVLVAVGVMLLMLPTFLAGGGPASSPTPDASSAAAGAGASGPARTSGPAATRRPRPRGTPRFYTVKQGDTLLRIARRFRVSETAIACASQLRNPELLHPGEILTIPPRGYQCPRRTPRPGQRQGG